MRVKIKNKGRIWLIAVASVLITIIGLLWMLKAAPLSWALWGPLNETDNVAMQGYDPVSYFKGDEPKLGDAAISSTWQGVKWHFSSAANKARFTAAPERYAPQFGGYCATAVSIGMTFRIDPEAWHRENGKLYLFFNEDARRDFVEQIPDGIIGVAEMQWAQ